MDLSARPPARAAAEQDPLELAELRRLPRRRRPSGQPPPLPRHIRVTGLGWLAAAVVLLVLSVVVFAGGLRGPAVAVTVVDDAVVRWLAGVRAPGLLPGMRALGALGSWVAISALLYGLLVALLLLRRLRHLLVVLAVWIMQGVIIQYVVSPLARRPRPFGVVFHTGWDAWALPSEKMAALAVILVGILYGLVPEGRWRQRGKWAATALVSLVGIAHIYLGVEAPTDVLVGVAAGVAIALLCFRLLAPSEVFPVAYGRGRAAHLDVGGPRGQAIRRALEDQLGVVADEIEPFGLAGSAGSTPLRIKLKGDPGADLFGKLYARSHLRSDRWYKLGRELLYGRLEDEKPFHSVRRLVQQEDYALRVVYAAGLPAPAPYGFVELTPEREYLLVTEFFEGATELGEADVKVDDRIIDDGLRIIRRLWHAGLAHRDIKPANLLVRDGQLMLIDVAFVEARPSPWRQAVDLANMMLCLALRSRTEVVYQRALRQFTIEEITEGFAAARGLAMPSQLRRMLRERGRDLHGEFLQLLPERPRPIRIQRWSARRLGLFALIVSLAAVLIPFAQEVLTNDYQHTAPLYIVSLGCGEPEPLWLLAQSVPSASLVPCVRALPAGWRVATAKARNGLSEFTLANGPDSQAVVVRLTPACTTRGATLRPSGQAGARTYERTDARSGQVTWYTVFAGGCVTAQLHPNTSSTAFADEASAVLGFRTRRSLQQALDVRSNGQLRLDPVKTR